MLVNNAIYCSSALIDIFNDCFLCSDNTCLVGGGAEPLYMPAQDHMQPAQIVFAYDYFASALHECSHWCIAGLSRRKLLDYGYWYAPDGRTESEQRVFEQVEIKPQALEWIFNKACGHRFRVSADNLEQGLGASEPFKRDICVQALDYCERGLPPRAEKFANALAAYYRQPNFLQAGGYSYLQLCDLEPN